MGIDIEVRHVDPLFRALDACEPPFRFPPLPTLCRVTFDTTADGVTALVRNVHTMKEASVHPFNADLADLLRVEGTLYFEAEVAVRRYGRWREALHPATVVQVSLVPKRDRSYLVLSSDFHSNPFDGYILLGESRDAMWEREQALTLPTSTGTEAER